MSQSLLIDINEHISANKKNSDDSACKDQVRSVDACYVNTILDVDWHLYRYVYIILHTHTNICIFGSTHYRVWSTHHTPQIFCRILTFLHFFINRTLRCLKAIYFVR